MVGCLSMLALAGGLLAAEWWLVGLLGLPHRPAVAGILALLATLAVGSLWGVAGAARRRAQPQDDPGRWLDGAFVRVEGVLQPRSHAVRSPISGEPAVYLAYTFRPSRGPNEDDGRWRARIQGLVAVPALLQTSLGGIPLRGMPPVRPWPRKRFGEPAALEAAARHVLSTRWHAAPEAADLVLQGPAAWGWPQADDDGAVDLHRMNDGARESLFGAGRADDPAVLRQRLADQHWMFEEQALAPGTRVVVEGVYRSLPRGIEVGMATMRPAQGVRPGAAAPLAARAWWSTVAFAAVLWGLAALAHGVALADGGALFRQVLQAFE